MICTYNEKTGRYRVEDATIRFPNFEGLENGSMNKAGKRNFVLVVDEDVASELEDQGIRVKEERRMNEDDPQMYRVKVGIYAEAKVHLVDDDVDKLLDPEDYKVIDREFREGYIRNGEIDVKFHVSMNRTLTPPVAYLRLDSIYIPVDEDEQAAKYASYRKE
jgi:hypothetical protein